MDDGGYIERLLLADKTVEVVQNPAGDYGVEAHQADVAKQSQIAVDMPFLTGLFKYAEGVSDTLLADMGATLVAGRLPVEGSDELAISTFLLGTFQKYGYLENETDKVTVTKAEDMLGKTLTLDGIAYTVCGVVDPGMDFSRYDGEDFSL